VPTWDPKKMKESPSRVITVPKGESRALRAGHTREILGRGALSTPQRTGGPEFVGDKIENSEEIMTQPPGLSSKRSIQGIKTRLANWGQGWYLHISKKPSHPRVEREEKGSPGPGAPKGERLQKSDRRGLGTACRRSRNQKG